MTSKLVKEARRLGCNDQLVIELADRVEAMELVLRQIVRSVSLHHCHRISGEVLKEFEND